MSRADSDLVVVDGSNIATEGRSTPSLAQLNEAVLSFREEFPDVKVTVVVDATFGHRIAKNEVTEFDEAVAHNELVAPPAGAVGRGDAFVLSIANKSGARILSNDSFQEFHGTYPWLFDEGRLIGGKPVPYVGWVFVSRLPVKGPVSRKARAKTAAAASAARPRSASKAASQPLPVPTAPPPGPAPAPKSPGGAQQSLPGGAKAGRKPAKAADARPAAVAAAAAAAPAGAVRGSPVNELLPFIDFVQHHPPGSSVSGVVESYSSHGAYVTIGDVRGYVPLRLMGDPAPRSARSVMKVGEAVTLVVDSFAPGRRSIDLALPGVAASGVEAQPVATSEPQAAQPPAKKARAAKKAPATKKSAARKKAAATEPPEAPAAKKRPAKKAAAKAAATEAAATEPPAKKSRAKKAASSPPVEPVEPKPTKRTRSPRTRKAAAAST
jgi:hypothetical protein